MTCKKGDSVERSFFPLLSCETVSSLMSDFWSPKSMDTVWARWRKGLSCGKTLAQFRKSTSQIQTDGSCFLFSITDKGVLAASHCKEEGAADDPSAG